MGSHARNRQFIKHPTNRFSDRTIAWLVLANFLRPAPLLLKDLTLYAGHSYATIRLVSTKLRRQGALTDQNKVDWTNPYVQSLNPPLEELPELPRNKTVPETPFSDRKLILNPQVEAILANKTDQSTQEIAHQFASVTPERAIAILSEWIESGQAGSQVPKFIDQLMSLYDRTSGGIAPPEPVSDAELQSRLLGLMDALPSPIVLLTIEAWNESYNLRTAPTSQIKSSESNPIPQEISGPLELADPGNSPESAPRTNP